MIGNAATFECIYDESVEVTAIWEINHLRYTYSSLLPVGHQFDETGSLITVHDVQLSMDGNSYQCIVNSCYSTVGHLTVVKGCCLVHL